MSSQHQLTTWERAKYAWHFIEAGQTHKIAPADLVAVVSYESKFNASAILPGCPRRGRKPRWCNRDGLPDVGLCQIHTGKSWTRVTTEQALDPRTNIMECARQLAIHARAHKLKRCDRRTSWHTRWPWARHSEHQWLQHHNMGSKGYASRVSRRARIIKYRTEKILRGYT